MSGVGGARRRPCNAAAMMLLMMMGAAVRVLCSRWLTSGELEKQQGSKAQPINNGTQLELRGKHGDAAGK